MLDDGDRDRWWLTSPMSAFTSIVENMRLWIQLERRGLNSVKLNISNLCFSDIRTPIASGPVYQQQWCSPIVVWLIFLLLKTKPRFNSDRLMVGRVTCRICLYKVRTFLTRKKKDVPFLGLYYVCSDDYLCVHSSWKLEYTCFFLSYARSSSEARANWRGVRLPRGCII